MTRATLAAMRGDFTACFRFHPLAIIMVPLIGTYAAASAFSYVRYGASNVDKYLTGKLCNTVILLLMVALVGVWIARFFGAFGGPVPV
jgi:hypothetical protein